MRRVQPLAAAGPLLVALSLMTAPIQPVQAYPYPLQNIDGEDHGAALRFIMPRQCVERCGVDGQYCCDSNTECFTSANIAGCSPKNGGGAWGIYTTTWTETNTFTATITTHWPEPTGASAVDCVPDLSQGESACGAICCADFQYCVERGKCGQRDGWFPPGGGGGEVTRTITSDGHTITTRFSAPFRPTGSTFSNGATSVASSAGATGTAIGSNGDGEAADEGTGGGLSAGAIAGIVIGVLAGLFLLGLICFCCIVRGLWALCCGGSKKKERERVEVVEERYRAGSRAPSAAAHTHREKHTGWFGRPASAGARRDEKDRGSGAKWLGLGAAAATLLALLNIRGKDKKPERKPRSRYTDSYYSYSDPSGSSAGGRSHRTRRSERAESRYSRR